MLIRHSKKPLPLDWSGLKGVNKAILQGLISVSGSCLNKRTLVAKILVFKNNKDLRYFFDKGLNKKNAVSRTTAACVQDLSCIWDHLPKKGEKQKPTFAEVDPRFFCVICFTLNKINIEVISHEAVHAAFAYRRRAKNKKWPWCNQNNEEYICYPAGRITSGINILFHENNIYKKAKQFKKKGIKNASNRPRIKK